MCHLLSLKRDGGATTTFLKEMGGHIHCLKRMVCRLLSLSRDGGATPTFLRGMGVPTHYWMSLNSKGFCAAWMFTSMDMVLSSKLPPLMACSDIYIYIYIHIYMYIYLYLYHIYIRMHGIRRHVDAIGTGPSHPHQGMVSTGPPYLGRRSIPCMNVP